MVTRLTDTYETRRVVVTDSLGVAVRFQCGVSLHDLVLEGSLLLRSHEHIQSMN